MMCSPTEVPEIRLSELRDHVIQQLLDVVSIGSKSYKEACGEKQEYLFVYVQLYTACNKVIAMILDVYNV